MSFVATRIQENRQHGIEADERPVVVVGTGPVGMFAAQMIHKKAPDRKIIIYGDEPWAPYNRVELSSFLSGDISIAQLADQWDDMDPGRIRLHLGTMVTRVNPKSRLVQDFRGEYQYYSELLLATGSRPHIPSIPGVSLPGVFTFRDLGDAHALMARRIRSRHTVVVGGGLLGIEIARAMQQLNTNVSLIDHSPRLMGRQLDQASAEMLQAYVLSRGIRVYLDAGIKQIKGEDRVASVVTHRGLELDCDSVVLATGIVPNIELAKQAGLAFGRGIIVDDNMRTSVEHVYAAGECAEHRGQVYGLVAPGIEQASVAAHVITGGQSKYHGSIAANRLKVLGKTVFSMGSNAEEAMLSGRRQLVYRAQDDSCYRKLTLKRGRLVGAIAYGSWEELNRLQEAVRSRKTLWPWQRLRFLRTGRIWPENATELVASWPADTRVCQCTGVTRAQLCDAMLAGCESVECLTAKTGASSVCGSCRPLLQQFVDADTRAQPLPFYRTLIMLSVLSLIVATLIAVLPPFAVSPSMETRSAIQALWTKSLYRQWTGFSMLGLIVIAMTISARKRIHRLRIGDFNSWRLLHVAMGVGMGLLLILHTGLQMGQGMNRMLLVAMLMVAASGAIAGGITALETFIGGRRARKLRSASFWLHLLGFWPLPVLLGMHILSVYYF